MTDLTKKSRHNPYAIMIMSVGALWIILFVSFILPISHFGIVPRNIFSLPCILSAPFLHAGFSHLIANSLSLIILCSIMITLERARTPVIILNVIIWGGLGTWIIGRSNSVHIGASGVIYGMMGYLISVGIFRRNLKTIIVSVLVFFLYGGAAFSGILPVDSLISWESHLCGFVVGILMSRYYARRDRRRAEINAEQMP